MSITEPVLREVVAVPLRSRAGVALITATVLGSGVASYDAFGANVAVPAIGRHFDAGVMAIQWTVTSHLLAVAALLILAGALADRFGRRRVLTVGLVVVFMASALCASAPTIHWLIAARVAQGVGAALVIPISLALLNGTLRVSDRGRGIGVWAGLTTLVATVGPYLGGWLVDHTSWRWVFVLPLPLIVLVLVALAQLPKTSGEVRAPSVDVVGAMLGIIGLGGLIFALTEGPGSGWSSPPVLVAFVVGGLSLMALLPFERRQQAPMLRLSLFESRQFDAINAVTLLVYGALTASGYLFVVQCQLMLGYTAAQAGAAFIPAAILFLALSPFSGALVARIGPRWLMFAGIVLIAAAQLWLAQLHPGSGYVDTILPAAVVQGVGLGLMVTPLTAAVLAAVADSDLGEASAINDAAAQIGAVVAIAVVPVLIGVGAGSSLGESLAHGYRPAMIAIAIVCAVAAVLTAIFVSDERMDCPYLASPAPHHGCALAVMDSAQSQPVASAYDQSQSR